jgi:hypothetical protein
MLPSFFEVRVVGRDLEEKRDLEAVMKAFSTSLLRIVSDRGRRARAGSIPSNRVAVGLER